MITLLNNQPIRLRNSEVVDDETCKCLGHNYCQPINKNDETQFQIKSDNEINNGDFLNDLNGWNIYLAVELDLISISNPTFATCDGVLSVSASGGTGPYQYSIDGGPFGGSGIFNLLCPGYHFIIAKDSIDNEGTLDFILEESPVCSTFNGSITDDLLSYNTNQLLNCYSDDFI